MDARVAPHEPTGRAERPIGRGAPARRTSARAGACTVPVQRSAPRPVSPRDRTALAPPPAPDALIRFPVWHVHAGTTFHRVTHGEHGPWWFSSDGSGRFDLVSPRGTCHLADDPVLAMLEVFGELVPRAVSTDWLTSRRLWSLDLPAQCDAADTTVR